MSTARSLIWLAVAMAATADRGWAAPAGSSDTPHFGTPAARQHAVDRLSGEQSRAKQAAWLVAQRQNWAPRERRGTGSRELTGIDGARVYIYTTSNYNAGISVNAALVRNLPPYDLDGNGLTIGVWDAGGGRTTHQELTGRVFLRDNAALDAHSTHVIGTIGATGVDPMAIGAAPQIRIDSYDWDFDLSEMTARAMSLPGEANRLQISNHSYGYVAGWDWWYTPPRWLGTWGNRESDYFGLYDEHSRDWDTICYGAPYYLPFKAAGNDRSDPAPNPGNTFYYFDEIYGWVSKGYDPDADPYADNWDQGGFDTISIIGTAKNVMTVGAVDDAVLEGQRHLAAAEIAPFSCWGPTDDGRVKPDIMANGVDVHSTSDVSDQGYDTMSGTSMATPNAAGSAMLLLQYYGRLMPGQYMRASTIKGLILHTADDLDNPGPDYRTGWGLMNVKAAADHIRAHHDMPLAYKMVEGVLNSQTPVADYIVTWNGVTPLRATLCWTDPPATALRALNNPSPRLVNDLDLRIIAPDGITTFYPFVLDRQNPAAPATTGDNVLDNVEQVDIPAPPALGAYTVRVSHKLALMNDEQHFSLLISGQRAHARGTVRFDKDIYRCDATIHVEVLDLDLVGQGSQAVTLTTQSGDVEPLSLAETPFGSGVFVGSIPGNTATPAAGDGAVQLMHGEVVTATYEDVRDATGNPAVTQDTAESDCEGPVVSGVIVTPVLPDQAVITFQTDETATIVVRYGSSCGNLDQSKAGTSAGTSHEVTLTNLTPGFPYYFGIETLDAIGNTRWDDNGGTCRSFIVPERPDYFTETFSNGHSIGYQSLTFVPNGSVSFYSCCRETATAFPVDPAGGTPLTLEDDGFAEVLLADNATIRFYGVAYDRFFVNSNGNLTFVAGDKTFNGTLANHFSAPRISAFFDDLNPKSRGTVSWQQLSDRAVVTVVDVPEYDVPSSNNYQVEMFFSGRIRLTHLEVGAKGGVVGLSRGTGLQGDFLPSDLDQYGACPAIRADFDGDVDVDLNDFSYFKQCFNGPNRPVLAACVTRDLDGDADVDLVDFRMFQACFNGPNHPPAATCQP